jgi:transcriptional regulator with XRE-family HTH domain
VSPLRELRKKRDLSQEQLAKLCGMHRNSIYNFEKGTWKEISSDHAAALAAALRVRPEELGLTIRSKGPPPSVRFRQLTPEQRLLIDELMSLSPGEYEMVRAALEHVRRARRRKRGRRR